MTEYATLGLESTPDHPYAQALVVERDGERIEVPITGVKHAAYVEWYGDVPEPTHFDRVYVADNQLHAERWNNGTFVVLVETEEGEWCATIENPSDADPAERELWRRPSKDRLELVRLVEAGLSPAEALDYWMLEAQGMTATDWAETRGVSHQAVSKNATNAREELLAIVEVL